MAETLDLRRAVMRCGECGQRFGADATFCPFDGAMLAPTDWSPAGDPLLNKVIDGRYEVVGVLGEGGMGTVYQVRHTALDRLFAMKVLRRDLARDADLAARFMREARATASVKHPNIVAINDFGRVDGDLPYFVMENLVGQTLARAIKTGGAIPSALGVRIVLKVAGALDAAHKEKIVHRDLKPDNVFLLGSAANPGNIDVRIVDFGAALILGASRVTKEGIVFGTPHYMSPEQASGQPVDHRADIYALGVIMYEMFTGRVPFVADTYMGVLTQHMFVKPVPPSQVSERARELGALEGVILRTLEKKPEHRYATMQELAADIERVSSFGSDGALRVASVSGDAMAPSRPVFAMANQLEPATREEVNARVTRMTTRRRRAQARAWVIYGGITLGVAAVTIAVLRLVQSRRDADAELPVTVTAIATIAAPTPPSPPSAAAAPPAAPALSEATAPRPASRPSPTPPGSPHPPPSSPLSAKKHPPAPGDFADPWAK
jgi:eukaryotic-like serine/threonine-protein kinase